MATLSLSTQNPTPQFHHRFPHRFPHRRHQLSSRRRLDFPTNPPGLFLRPIAAATRFPSIPPTAPSGELYQPFRPPSSPLPAKYRSLGIEERLDILRNRLGLWHDYAPLVSSLFRDGFSHPSIEEITGISGVEQNLISVASQVRESLLACSFPTDTLAYFDAASGANLLYELRLLNADQRSAVASHVAEHHLDAKAAQELARSIKDFPRRMGEPGWECFSADSPSDCLAYARFRLSREAMAVGDQMAVLEKALEVAETEDARSRIQEEVQKREKGEAVEEEEEKLALTAVPVMRLRYGEVSEASAVVLLPVCRAANGRSEMEAAPGCCRSEGEMGVVAADRKWGRWVVLPGWGPVAAVAGNGGVAVEFSDGRVLPWRKHRWVTEEEAVLVVGDRTTKKVQADGFYLVQEGEEEGALVVERGRKLLELGKAEALGAVVLVVRPPREENDDRLRDEDWE